MHSNSYRLVRAVERCQNLYSCIGGGRGAQNISTKQYWFRQYKVTSNSFKTHPLQKYPNFLLTQSHPTQGKEKLYGMRIKSTLKYKIKIQWIEMYSITFLLLLVEMRWIHSTRCPCCCNHHPDKYTNNFTIPLLL